MQLVHFFLERKFQELQQLKLLENDKLIDNNLPALNVFKVVSVGKQLPLPMMLLL